MNSTININFLSGNNNLHASEPPFVIEKYNVFFDKFYDVSLYFLFSLSFQYFLLNGCFFLNLMLISSTPKRKESQCCFYFLMIYGVLISFPPPLVYELVMSNDFNSLIHISAEMPKNLSLFLRIVSTYLIVAFALNCYHIVFSDSTKDKYSKFYIYFSIALFLTFSFVLTLLLWFLRHFLFTRSNSYCHLNIMASIQSVYCPETTYWLVYILLIYIIPIVIPFLVYPRVIYEVMTKYEWYECDNVKYLVDINKGKHLYRSDYSFLQLSCAITLIFLLSNFPFVVIEILHILKFNINIMVAISFEIIARFASVSYPYICIKCKLRNGEHFEYSFHSFVHPELRNNKPYKLQSLLVDCEAIIKEQEELLKVMRVNVKTIPSSEIQPQLANEIQVHNAEL